MGASVLGRILNARRYKAPASTNGAQWGQGVAAGGVRGLFGRLWAACSFSAFVSVG